MGLLFAWALMGLPLVYAIWSLAQDRNEAQLAGHARMEPNENRSQTPRRDETSVQSDMGHTDAKAAISPDASQPPSDFIDELATLQTRLIDVLAGYKAMLEKAEPEIQPIVNEYIDTHELHEKQLAERLTNLGHKADEDGSFFSVVQDSIVRVRSMFTEIGTNTLPQIVDGENSLIDLYRKTVGQATLETDRALLERQMQELSELIHRTDVTPTS